MTKTSRSIDELNAELNTQINFLLKSCYSFDNGDLLEAKRMSSTLRILLKDKGSSASLFWGIDTGISESPRKYICKPLYKELTFKINN